MSKQSEAREKQEYDPKPVHAMCSNCRHFSSDFLDIDGYLKEKNMRCKLGGFAVRKPAVCREHQCSGSIARAAGTSRVAAE